MTGIAAGAAGVAPAASGRVPVIDITDLYHPHQDVGDNFDLIAAYALPEIDLRAVILDVTGRFRRKVALDAEGKVADDTGPRDPGIIPVTQLNYLFDRNVPYGAGSFEPLPDARAKLLDAPEFEQSGVRLILDTLRASREKVHIVSFGSARPLAAAFNREPDLLRAKVARVHLSAGATSPDFLEWNVILDPKAIACLLRSGLPVAIYPCATKDGPFAMDSHNSFWKLPDLGFLPEMEKPLGRYLAYAFERSARPDFLQALEEGDPSAALARFAKRPHNVWETAVWIEVSGRRLVRRADGSRGIVPASEVRAGDKVLPNELQPCRVEVRDNGAFAWKPAPRGGNHWMYYRGDPAENAAALTEALPALYRSFRSRSPRR